ncbi:MAG TPA: hypothetical protein G4O03_00580 [Dehalococcoidia bacterium]|jgi:hypothetical protein|nr:hypothetical protein [Dehalococcoidia bacterium]
MAREKKQKGAEKKVIAFRVSELTFQALERLKRRHAKSWPELTLNAIIKVFSESSEEDAADCRQVEAELRGEAPAGQAESSEAVAETVEAVVETGESAKISQTLANKETPSAEAPEPSAEGEELQTLVAAVVICKGCERRMTRGTLVVKTAEGYYHPSCVPGRGMVKL